MFRLVLVLMFGLSHSGICAVKAHDASKMGLKNFREILASLATVTGVDPTLPEISSFYTQIVGQLPRHGTLSEFNAQSFLAAAGLGGVFCNRVITQDAMAGIPKTGFNAGVDFSKGPSAVSTSLRAQLIVNYTTAFLQRGPTATEKDQLTSLFSAQTDATDTPAETQAAILSVCGAVASSIEFLSN